MYFLSEAIFKTKKYCYNKGLGHFIERKSNICEYLVFLGKSDEAEIDKLQI